MLDDCKGEKFDEIIAKFAMSVLKRTVQSKVPASEVSFKNCDQGQKLPLILAYRHSLRTGLRARMEKNDNYKKTKQALEETSDEIRRICQELQPRNALKDRSVQQKADELRSKFERSWVGDEIWIDFLIDGRTEPDSKTSFLPNFDDMLRSSSTVTVQKRSDAPRDLLTDLNERITKHQSRLEDWNAFKAKIEKDSRDYGGPDVKKIKKTTRSLFTEHKSLLFDPKLVSHGSDSREEPCSHPCRDLTVNMHEELAAVRKNESTHRVSEILSSTDKTSLASEERATRIRPDSLLSSEQTHDLMSKYPHAHPSPQVRSDSSCSESPPKFPEALDADQASADLGQHPETPLKTQSFDDHVDVQLAQNDNKSPIAENLHDQRYFPTPRALSPLAENLIPSDEIKKPTSNHPRPARQSSIPIETLMERTRQSMSLLPNQPNTANEKRKRTSNAPPKQTRHSQLFPVNQFETPPKAAPADSPRSGESTPREKLFSEEAEYSSVFKSRPRIATSPSLSPERSGLGLDSMLEDMEEELAAGMGHVTLDSSPLRSRNVAG